MNIYIANKKIKKENIIKKYPKAFILDLTSTSDSQSLRVLSPFYPHGNIPIPGMPEKKATCVEAVWQGLKVFESCGIDYATFQNDSMKNIKRTIRKFGKPLGHKYGDRLLNYKDARWMIYLPTYLYVLENVPSVHHTLSRLKQQMEKGDSDLVFLDYNTNCNVFDYSKPLSHAGLVKLYLEGKYPQLEDKEKYNEFSKVSICTTVGDIIQNIINHPKYIENQEKYEQYIQELQTFEELDWLKVKKLSNKRDGWKKIVDDVRKNLTDNNQLSLF